MEEKMEEWKKWKNGRKVKNFQQIINKCNN